MYRIKRSFSDSFFSYRVKHLNESISCPANSRKKGMKMNNIFQFLSLSPSFHESDSSCFMLFLLLIALWPVISFNLHNFTSICICTQYTTRKRHEKSETEIWKNGKIFLSTRSTRVFLSMPKVAHKYKKLLHSGLENFFSEHVEEFLLLFFCECNVIKLPAIKK